jgi:hypothetical protein
LVLFFRKERLSSLCLLKKQRPFLLGHPIASHLIDTRGRDGRTRAQVEAAKMCRADYGETIELAAREKHFAVTASIIDGKHLALHPAQQDGTTVGEGYAAHVAFAEISRRT